MIPVDSARLRLDHTTLMQVERKIETIEDGLKALTREVDGIDVSPSYTCDCSCDGEIEDLYSDIDALHKRIEKLEAMITQGPGTAA